MDYELKNKRDELFNRIFSVYALYIVLLMILIYTAIFSYYTIAKNNTYQTHAYDFGIFLNSFWNTIHEGKFFYTSLWEGSRFQNHFAPILFFFLLPAYIIPKLNIFADFLLGMQSFILALGALPIYWIAKNEISKKAGIIFALLYLSYPALQGINRFDFHEVALAPTMILFAFHYFKEQKYKISGIFIVLSLISREDVAMVIVPMAMLWLWDSKGNWSVKNKETIFCISTIIIGMIWFIITTGIIIPMLSPEGYWFVSQYKPEYLLIDANKKLNFLIDIFIPLLFTPLFSKLLLVATPIFARILFTNRETRYSIDNQHTALLIPFVFLSSIYFVKNISKNEYIKKLNLKTYTIYLIILCLSISFFISPIKTEILSHNTIPKLTVIPDGGPIPQNRILKVTPHYNTLNQIIDQIPINASVYTQNNIFPHMADRPNVYYVQGDNQIFRGWNNPQIAQIVPWKNVSFDYILVDNSNNDKNNKRWSTLRNLDIESLDILKRDYGLYVAIDQIYLFKRGYNGTANLSPGLMENFDNGYIDNYYNGIFAEYYNNNNLDGSPVLRDRVENINFKWKKISPIPGVIDRYNFSLRFDGYLYIPQDGYYSFQLLSDGGSRLFIDGRLMINSWITERSVEKAFQAHLDVGLHRINVDYKDRLDNSFVYLNWYTPWKGLFEPVPEEYFYLPKDSINKTNFNSNIENIPLDSLNPINITY